MELELPAGAKLTRVERDGLAIVPTREGKGLSIPLVAPHAARSFCTVTLDYLADRGSGNGEGVLHPPLPMASFPCLSFCWEVLAPEPWAVADDASGLLATDPGPFGTGPGSWSSSRGWAELVADALEALPAEDGGASRSRAVAVTRCPGGRDPARRGDPGRMVHTLGFGPGAAGDRPRGAGVGRLGPEVTGRPPAIHRVAPGAAQATLRPLGLAVVPTRRHVADHRGARPRPSRGRAGRVPGPRGVGGCDASTPSPGATTAPIGSSRWRAGAARRRPRSRSGVRPPSRSRFWRVGAAGGSQAPAGQARVQSVHLIDEQRRAGWGWTVGLAIVLAGVAGRRASARLRGTVLTLVLAAHDPGAGALPSAAGAGRLGCTGGRAWRCPALARRVGAGRARRRARTRSTSTLQRLNSGVTTTASLLLAVVTAGLVPDAVSRARDRPARRRSPIIALLPYDGPPDPDRRPDRVILRREDAEHLQALAAIARGSSSSPPRALSATHRVIRRVRSRLAVESEYLLERDPGQVGLVDVPRRGRRTRSPPRSTIARFRCRSSQMGGPGLLCSTDREPAGSEPLLAPDPPVRRSPPRGARKTSRGSPSTPWRPPRWWSRTSFRTDRTSRSRAPGDGSGARDEAVGVAGLLGPANRLEVRWSARAEPGLRRDRTGPWRGCCSGMPSRPAIMSRPGSPTGGPEERPPSGSASNPAWSSAPAASTGLVDASWQGSDERPEWVASVDPPLADGATIRARILAPRPRSGRRRYARCRGSSHWASNAISGALGFRRPAGWSGRLGRRCRASIR